MINSLIIGVQLAVGAIGAIATLFVFLVFVFAILMAIFGKDDKNGKRK